VVPLAPVLGVLVWALVLLPVEETILVDELVRQVTMPMSNKHSSSKNMSNNRCGDPPAIHPNTPKVDMAWEVVHRLHGRECTMTFHNLLSLAIPAVVDVVDFRRVEATEDQHPRKAIQPRHLQLTLRLDQRTPESQVRIIVAAVEVDNEATTHTLGDEAV
jgi:hypothetical protein